MSNDIYNKLTGKAVAFQEELLCTEVWQGMAAKATFNNGEPIIFPCGFAAFF